MLDIQNLLGLNPPVGGLRLKAPLTALLVALGSSGIRSPRANKETGLLALGHQDFKSTLLLFAASVETLETIPFN